MAAIVHGCGSPRQHQGSSSGGVVGTLSSTRGCLPNSYHQQQQQQHLPHQTSAPMYSSMPKYTRSSSQPTATPNHPHHIYSVGNNSTSAQYKKQSMLPPSMSYLPKPPSVQQPSQFVHSQRPLSASATAVDTCRSYMAHPSATTMIYRSARHSNRKSAVELLAESKPFYVKSETVMERLQQQSANYRGNTSTIGCGSKRGRNSLDSATSDRFNVSSYSGVSSSSCLQADMERSFIAPSPMHHSGGNGSRGEHMHHHHHHHGHIGRRGAGSTNNLLQSKLRKLLSTEAGNKDLCISRSNERYREDIPTHFDFSSNKTLSGSCIQELSLSNQADPSMIIPQSFLSPQSLPLQSDTFDDIYNYGIDNSSTEGGPLVLTDDYRAISPPAEYAADTSQAHNEQRSRYNYQRSYSHSHEVAAEDPKYATANAYNINSHKSLPDLHSQISRHSPHSEILSCCSRGNRSIKSTGESSLNRDSGGSSGHYTHRSEPCYKQQRGECERDIVTAGPYDTKIMCTSNCSDYRRDSGSSTQHSANSYCGYASPSYRNFDCAECRCRNNSIQMDAAEYLLNFTTPEVPEAFQDDYSPPSPSVTKYAQHVEEQRLSSQQKSLQHSAQTYQHQQQRAAKQMQNQMLQSPGSAPSVEDLSPPPIQFKRQKCIRFKNRHRVSISNAAMPNDNGGVIGGGGGGGEVYIRNSERPTFFFPKSIVSTSDTQQQQQQQHHHSQQQQSLQQHHYKREQQSSSRRNSQQSLEMVSTPREAAEIIGVSDLEKFFDRLGLNDDKFHEIYSPPKRRHSAETDSDESSTVFFSDVSTVDSMRLPDSTETQPQTTQTYRPSEPPSIVERNARIIKWLCNCRKLQYT